MKKINESVISFAKKIKRQGRCAIAHRSLGDSFLLKKARDNKEPIPEKWSGIVKIVEQVVDIAAVYAKRVENNLVQGELNPKVMWEREDCRYSEIDPENPTLNGIIRRHKSQPDRKYVRVIQPRTKDNAMIKGNYREVYKNNKGEIIEISLEDKERYFKNPPSKKGSQKQGEAGCSKETVPLNIKAENLIYAKSGDNVYTSDLLKQYQVEIIKEIN